MTKSKKRQRHQSWDLMPTIKTIETAILITISVYKAVKLVVEEIRTKCVSPEPTERNEEDQWRIK